MEITIHDPSQLKQRQLLFIRAFPETIGTPTESETHYQWKFHSKKDVFPASYEYAVHDQGAMVGYYAAIPYLYQTKQGLFSAGMVCDVMTDPAHQGKGIFTKIGRFATNHLQEKSLDVTTGYPIRPEVIPGHIKVGWKALFELPIYARPAGFRTLPVLKKFPRFFTQFLSVVLEKISLLLEIGRIDSSLEWVEYSSPTQIPEGELNALMKKWSEQQAISLQKTPAFLQWRLSAPQVQYLLAGFRKNGQLVSLQVFRVTDLKGVKTLAILDWIEDTSVSIPRANFSKKLRQLSVRFQADLIALMANEELIVRLRLYRLGFIKTPIRFTFILKNLSQKFADPYFANQKNWHLMWIDSDDL